MLGFSEGETSDMDTGLEEVTGLWPFKREVLEGAGFLSPTRLMGPITAVRLADFDGRHTPPPYGCKRAPPL